MSSSQASTEIISYEADAEGNPCRIVVKRDGERGTVYVAGTNKLPLRRASEIARQLLAWQDACLINLRSGAFLNVDVNVEVGGWYMRGSEELESWHRS